MNKEQHTPTPWKLSEQSSTSLFDGKTRIAIHIELPDGRKVLCPDKETAGTIICAVKSHEELLRAAKLALEYISKKSNGVYVDASMHVLEAAIAKAERK